MICRLAENSIELKWYNGHCKLYTRDDERSIAEAKKEARVLQCAGLKASVIVKKGEFEEEIFIQPILGGN